MNRRSFSETFQASHVTWLLLALILAGNLIIRWHLRTMPLERDEGEYAYAGQLLLQGVPPYQDAYNMKFPGVYYAYAAIMALFGQTPAGIHLGVIIVTSLSIVLMFFIGRILLDDFGGLVAAAIFGTMSALPSTYGLAGHATHFVVLFVCAGTFALLHAGRNKSKTWIFVSGAAFATAVLMKQHAVIFCLVALALLVVQNWKTKPWLPAAIFSAGIALPLALMAAMLVYCGVWKRFEFWTVEYARQYVSILSLNTGLQEFTGGFGPVFVSALWTWILGLGALAMLFFPSPYRRAVRAGSGLLFAGLIAVSPGFYFRGHYFLMVLPGLALLVSALLLELAARLKKIPHIPQLRFLPACLLALLLGEIVLRNGAEWFLSPPEELSRKIYGYNPFPEVPAVAAYLAAHSDPTDTVVVLGSEPELFFLAHRRSATGYIYIYPLTENQPLAGRMRSEFFREIEAARPRFAIYVNKPSSWRSDNKPDDPSAGMDEINSWWVGYEPHYHIVGVVDMHDDAPTEFFWEKGLANRTNTDQASLYILRRKDEAAPKN